MNDCKGIGCDADSVVGNCNNLLFGCPIGIFAFYTYMLKTVLKSSTKNTQKKAWMPTPT